MSNLRVRAYNVRFGDAILVSIPDRAPDGSETIRHMLIDVGNVLAGSGGEDEVFEPVIEDILAQLNGKPLDLYVMTHEHMDHVQGLLWAKEKRGLDIRATHSWLTASAAPDYYDRFSEAKKKRLEAVEAHRQIALYFQTAAAPPPDPVQAMMLNNNPRRTDDCVTFLRGVGSTTTFIFRGAGLNGSHPFQEAQLEVWGPEEDTSIYYGSFQPMALGLTNGAGAAAEQVVTPKPPPGVDAGAFYNLVDYRRRGVFDNLFAIDKAANNTSVVFLLQWRGWKLLFPGDAEHRAWKEMDKRGLLRSVHFLKVGHHGSANGSPPPELMEKILPAVAPDSRKRRALVSTHKGTYAGVPSTETVDGLRGRCDQVISIGEAEDGLFSDIEFTPDGT